MAFDTIILGNTVHDWAWFLLFILFGFIASWLLVLFSKRIFHGLAKKTANKLDDIISNILEKPFPFQLIIVTLFLNIGFEFLTVNAWWQNFVTQASFLVYVFGISLFIIKFLLGVINEYLTKYTQKTDSKYDDQLIPLLRTFTKIMVWIGAVLLVLSNFGFNVTSLLAGLGIGGLAVAMASREILENLISGIIIFAEKTFAVGDFVKTGGGIMGTVEELKIRSTRIRQLDGTLVTLPNSNIVSTDFQNITNMTHRRVDQTLGVEYSTPLAKLKKGKDIIKSILKKNKHVDNESIMIAFNEFADYSLNIRVVYQMPPLPYNEYLEIVDDINLNIKKEFEKAKIVMAFPTQTIELKK